MNHIHDLLQFLENRAPFSLQESYDNSGLIYGDSSTLIKGLLVSLDVTDQILEEAISSDCNVILAHHPLIFESFKKISPNNPGHRMLIRAIKNDIAIIAFHTNFDNIASGVSYAMAGKLGLKDGRPLQPSALKLMKLVVFVPAAFTNQVREDLGRAGAGKIGNYDFCSFSSSGIGTYKPLEGAVPYSGNINKLSMVEEDKLEVIFPEYRVNEVLSAMRKSHPYEEIAYDLIRLQTSDPESGSGWVGQLPEPLPPEDFLQLLKRSFDCPGIRFSSTHKKEINTVAVCGGSGSFLITQARRQNVDAFVTSDIKYHQFFEPDHQFLLADIGHFESEMHFIESVGEEIKKKNPNFAVRLSGLTTNPVNYWL